MLDHLQHLIAHSRELAREKIGRTGAEQRLLVDDHHGLRRLASKRVHDVQIVDCRLGDDLVPGAEAESVLQAALDYLIGDADVHEVGNVVFCGRLRCRQAYRARIRADDRRHPGFVHFFHFRHADFGFGLRIAQDRFEFRAAHGLDASGGVDLVDGELRSEPAQLAGIGDEARHGMQDADLYGRRLRTGNTLETEGPGRGGGRKSGGLLEKLAAALLDAHLASSVEPLVSQA